ncbi:hypothetical protein HO133_002530 [Letharia lupina]|uniref:Uncharacterized protein n=1 Tax=Letharia lupina TaxID=560253 RepID=A0A8H6FA50_9LECA|nr:uncharacterized protein HO133_002530 [Letharia lupina]KAF6220850.1 hypothetical protein HO133_002530 [Letharia lupina]
MTAQSVGHAELKTRARERDEDNLKLKAENEALGQKRDRDAQITAAVNRDWTAVQPHLDNVLRETNVVLVQQRDVLMKDLDQAHRKNDDLQKLTQGLMEKQEDSESSNVAKLEKEQQELVQLRVRVSALGKAAEQADIQRKRLEHVRRAENRGRELKFEPGNDKLRAKAKALELTCNDMKPKIAKLQAVVQRARRTREAFVHRWDEIKRLTYSTHKEQQLLAALAEIVNEELLE